MNYFEFEIVFCPFSEEIAEILMAELAEIGFDSFEQTEEGLKAYVPEKYFDKPAVETLLSDQKYNALELSFQSHFIEAQNWNAVWESNFEPITIKDQLLVKAPFHNIEKEYKYVIEIEPKMSFGTGHHETTSLILEQMIGKDFSGVKLLDMGCGTGILAIFAKILGATDITAIDIDEWAYENAIENVSRNNSSEIKVLLGDASAIPQTMFGVVIANINRNILLADIQHYAKVLRKDGQLYLSGFYVSDIEDIKNEAEKHGFKLCQWNEKKNWAACIFEKVN